MVKFANLIAIVSVTIVLVNSRDSLADETLETFNQLHEAGKSLESASAKLAGERNEKILYYFVREPKSAICERYYGEVLSVVDQYRIKALAFVDESRQPKSWFSSFKRNFGPLGPMRSLSKNFAYLCEATEALVAHSNVEPLTEDDVRCDLAKFQIDSLEKVLFILQTDITYLITEQRPLVDRAILRQLREAKYTANHNFFAVDGLSPAQRQLLKNFYLGHVDEDRVTVGEAVDHFDEPSNLVLGRLYDSCHALQTFTRALGLLQPERAESCSKSSLAIKKAESNNNNNNQSADYDQLEFCNSFLNGL